MNVLSEKELSFVYKKGGGNRDNGK